MTDIVMCVCCVCVVSDSHVKTYYTKNFSILLQTYYKLTTSLLQIDYRITTGLLQAYYSVQGLLHNLYSNVSHGCFENFILILVQIFRSIKINVSGGHNNKNVGNQKRGKLFYTFGRYFLVFC